MKPANLFALAVARTRALAFQDPQGQLAMVREAASLPPLVTVHDLLAKLEHAETPVDVIRELVTDAEAWDKRDLKKAVERHERAHAIKRLRNELTAGARSMPPAFSHGERFDLVAQSVQDLLDRLTALAKDLPDGELALDPTANIDAGTAEDLAEVRQLLRRLGHIVGFLPHGAGRNRGVAADLLTLLDVPATGPSIIRRHDGAEQNPNPQRDIIRSLMQGQQDDCDVALLDVLRGSYPGVIARLASSRAEQAERDERVGSAQQTQWVDK